MAQQTSYTPPKQVTIDGRTYQFRTAMVWNDRGQKGTINDDRPPTFSVEIKGPPTLGDPVPQFQTLADRTSNKSVNNGWSFRPIAAPVFKEELLKTGSTSLTAQLDSATVSQLAKDAVVPPSRAQQALSKTALTQQNKDLAAANQSKTAPSGGQNKAQANQEDKNKTAELTDKDWREAVGKSEGGTRKKFPKNLRYPLDLDKSKQDKIQFDMLEYIPGEFNKQTFGFPRPSEREAQGRSTIGRVYLPIPAGITETTGATWGEDRATAGQIAAGNIAVGGITGGGEGFSKALENVVGTTSKASGEVKSAIAGAIAGDAAGIPGLLTRVTGAALNPNLELLFNGPTLRPFNFTFKLSARSKEEAQQIIGIIRFFKQGMAPHRSESNLFVKSPHTFKIKYIHNNQEHKFLNKFKECALQNFTVDYTPEGNYATYYDGMLVSYQITMQFTELEPIFNADYGPGTGSSAPDTEIGF